MRDRIECAGIDGDLYMRASRCQDGKACQRGVAIVVAFYLASGPSVAGMSAFYHVR